MIDFLKALADLNRAKIVIVLSKGEFSVLELSRILNLGQSLVSHHLKILFDRGVISYRKDGSWIFYRISEALENHRSSIVRAFLNELSNDVHLIDEICFAIDKEIERRKLRSKTFFSNKAKDWTEIRNKYLNETTYIDVLKQAVGRCSVLADLGCGSGDTIKQLRDSAEKFIGIDNSQEMLHLAKECLDHSLGSRVDFRLGDLEHLPMRDAEADTVVLSMVLHHVAQPIVVLNEVYRVLRNTAKLIIIDFEKHNLDRFRTEMADFWLGFSFEEIKTWLEEIGFRCEQIKKIPGALRGVNLFLMKGIKE